MSDSPSKKLEVKSELLRHLDTAEKMRDDNVPSSNARIYTISLAIALAEAGHPVDVHFIENEVMKS